MSLGFLARLLQDMRRGRFFRSIWRKPRREDPKSGSKTPWRTMETRLDTILHKSRKKTKRHWAEACPTFPSLPLQAQRKLNDARRVPLRAQILQPRRCVRIHVHRMVEHVKEIGGHLGLQSFRERDILEDREVLIPGS